ncbi:hypothetical protein [Thermoflexus sp.]|uniref:hypothetical protein n=1 Tax=Thermoflexus sp. TaxID=1969742 RepID=UPI0035E43BCB
MACMGWRWILLLPLIAACRPAESARYTMDFKNGAPGWPLSAEARFTVRTENGHLVLSLKPPRTVGWVLSPFSFRDGQVEVEGALLEGPSSTDYGLILQAGEGRFYRFAVSADGYYGVFLYEQGSWRILVDWTMHAAIRTGRTTNHLRVRRAGTEMIFWVNGMEVARIQRGENEGGGRAGVSMGTMAWGNARVAFDRFAAVRDR